MNGWIKLHRKLLDNPISNRPEYAWLWTVLLLLANHDENKFIFNGKEEVVRKGQVLTGREKLSTMTGIKPTSVENILRYLEKTGQIGQQKTNKFRLITVIKYSEYQEVGQQMDNKVTTNGQQMDTNKNVKNEKNVKNKTYTDKNLSLNQVAELINKAFAVYLNRNFKGIDSFKANLEYWLETYTPKDIEVAIRNIKYHDFWRDKMTPVILFRRKNPQGEPVDYISQLLLVNKNDGNT